MQGQTINGFVLKKLLGEGGLAEVWYAENEIGKPAAVKVLFEKLSRNAQIVERFYDEAIMMVKLKHPNIRQVYGYGYLSNRHCIIMEYLDGDDLSNLMKKGRSFTEQELKRWWNQIVGALNYTHAQGIAHLDIKPSNIFLDGDDNIKLLDFGIAKMMENSSLTQTGSLMGTLMYMSPEQVKDAKNIDYRTDIYSLAISFVHLLTGKKPYDTDTTSDFEIRKQIMYTPYDVRVLNKGWQVFLAPYLEKEPDKRPALRPFEVVASMAETTIVSGRPTNSNAAEAKQPTAEPEPQPQPMTDNATITSVNEISKADTDKPKKKRKVGLGIGIGATALVVLVAVVVLFLKLKENSSDNAAYHACVTTDDYRSYMRTFGSDGLHYNEAKAEIARLIADSTVKALQAVAEEQARQLAEAEARARAEAEQREDEIFERCNTIADCDSYLEAYPQGRYVTEVKVKKAELEKKSADQATAKRETQQAVSKSDAHQATAKRELQQAATMRELQQVVDEKKKETERVIKKKETERKTERNKNSKPTIKQNKELKVKNHFNK